MTHTWILVAHDAGARVFQQRGPGKGLELLESIEHSEGRTRNRDIDSDRPGRAFRKDSGDPRRAAMSRSEDPHQRVVANFARDLADRLRRARVHGRYQRLALVAPPRFLGLLRASLDDETSKLVLGSVDKNLASSTEEEIIEHLGAVIAV